MKIKISLAEFQGYYVCKTGEFVRFELPYMHQLIDINTRFILNLEDITRMVELKWKGLHSIVLPANIGEELPYFAEVIQFDAEVEISSRAETLEDA